LKLFRFLQTRPANKDQVFFTTWKCAFQAEVLLRYLRREYSSAGKKYSIQKLDLGEVAVEELLSLLENRSLYGSPTLFQVEGVETAGEQDITRILKASQQPANPQFRFLIRIPKKYKSSLPSQSVLVEEEFDPHDKREYLRIKVLTQFCLLLMEESGLPKSNQLANTMAKRCCDSPLEIFSKIQTLELFLSEDRVNFEVNDVLPLFREEKQPPFKLLDAVGLRHAERILKEFPEIERSVDSVPLALLAAVKNHLKDLFTLANWIEKEEMLILLKLSDQYFKEYHYLRKKETAQKIREFFKEKLPEEEYQYFLKMKPIKFDMPLAKLVYQLRFHNAETLEDSLLRANQVKQLLQSTNLPPYQVLFALLLSCTKKYADGSGAKAISQNT